MLHDATTEVARSEDWAIGYHSEIVLENPTHLFFFGVMLLDCLVRWWRGRMLGSSIIRPEGFYLQLSVRVCFCSGAANASRTDAIQRCTNFFFENKGARFSLFFLHDFPHWFSLFGGFVPSRATLVLAPSNLQGQWVEEIKKSLGCRDGQLISLFKWHETKTWNTSCCESCFLLQ